MKHAVSFLTATIFALWCSYTIAAPQGFQRPNILFIAVDDLNDWIVVSAVIPRH